VGLGAKRVVWPAPNVPPDEMSIALMGGNGTQNPPGTSLHP
jgi:hypothetical protein